MYEYVIENDVWLYYRIMKALGSDLTPDRLNEMEKYAKKVLSIIKKVKPDENGVRTIQSDYGKICLSPNGVLSFPWFPNDATGYKYVSDVDRPILTQEEIDDMNADTIVMPDFTADAIKVAKANSRKNRTVDIRKYTKARLQNAIDNVIIRPYYERNVEKERVQIDYDADECFPPISTLLLAKHLRVDIFKVFGEPFMFSSRSGCVCSDSHTRLLRKFNDGKSFVDILRMLECQEKMPVPLVRTRDSDNNDKSLLSEYEYNSYLLNMLRNYASCVLNLLTPLRVQHSKRSDMRDVTIMIPTDAGITRLYKVLYNLEPKTDVCWGDDILAADYIRGMLHDAQMDFAEMTIPYGEPYTTSIITATMSNLVTSRNNYDVAGNVHRLKNLICSLYDAMYELTDNNPIMRKMLEYLGLIETGYHPTFHEEGLYLPEFPKASDCESFISVIRRCSSYGTYLETKSRHNTSCLEDEYVTKYNEALVDIRMKLFGADFICDIKQFADAESFISRFTPIFEKEVKRMYIGNPKSFDECSNAVNRTMSQIFKEELEKRGIAV